MNENLYRYVNDRLSLTDMDFVSGFSLFRKDGNTLKLILDKETSGNSLDLNLDTDVNSRNIVAFRMNMLEGEIWVLVLADSGSTPWSQWKMKVNIADASVSKGIAKEK